MVKQRSKSVMIKFTIISVILAVLMTVVFFTYSTLQKGQAQLHINTSTKFNHTSNEIQIFSIKTEPSVVVVNNTFKIHVIIINNSSEIITFKTGCFSPLSVKLNTNMILTGDNNISCYAIRKATLKPRESIMLVAPTLGTSYKALSAGLTKAIVSFSYNIQQNNSLLSTSTSRISEPFLFTIYRHS
jgi:hypothetical protein